MTLGPVASRELAEKKTSLRGELDGLRYYAAGVPWFSTLFGRDSLIAAYQTLGAVGTLTAAGLQLPVELYDPEKHYREVRNKWWGLNSSGQ